MVGIWESGGGHQPETGCTKQGKRNSFTSPVTPSAKGQEGPSCQRFLQKEKVRVWEWVSGFPKCMWHCLIPPRIAEGGTERGPGSGQWLPRLVDGGQQRDWNPTNCFADSVRRVTLPVTLPRWLSGTSSAAHISSCTPPSCGWCSVSPEGTAFQPLWMLVSLIGKKLTEPSTKNMQS